MHRVIAQFQRFLYVGWSIVLKNCFNLSLWEGRGGVIHSTPLRPWFPSLLLNIMSCHFFIRGTVFNAYDPPIETSLRERVLYYIYPHSHAAHMSRARRDTRTRPSRTNGYTDTTEPHVPRACEALCIPLSVVDSSRTI
jgi:hypothetical protein